MCVCSQIVAYMVLSILAAVLTICIVGFGASGIDEDRISHYEMWQSHLSWRGYEMPRNVSDWFSDWFIEWLHEWLCQSCMLVVCI